MENQEGKGKGLGMSPCSLANGQRVFWGVGGDSVGRKKRRRKRADSQQEKEKDRALKRGEYHC